MGEIAMELGILSRISLSNLIKPSLSVSFTLQLNPAKAFLLKLNFY
tara:strand:- start:12922 stop:13059 length:138 start_codon:yes stop_codon:yes gene_type:complete